MIENKKVTIVISAFNKEKYIQKSIKSVLDQSYTNIELFIIDDGSTDKTYEQIKNFKFLPKENLLIFTKKNEGVASCRNIGIEKGSGDYILFLDGDDTLMPNAIIQAVNLLEITKSSIVFGGWNYIDENDKFIKEFNVPSFDDYLEKLLLGNIFAICSVFCDLHFLRSKVGKYKFYTVTDDWEYWIRCAKNNAKFYRSGIIFSNVKFLKLVLIYFSALNCRLFEVRPKHFAQIRVELTSLFHSS
jgi:glycosyltransferase involved in cell wall biosynthesis